MLDPGARSAIGDSIQGLRVNCGSYRRFRNLLQDDNLVRHCYQSGNDMRNQYYVYILASKPNGTLYVGVTNNLIRRVWEHKQKLVSGFTTKYSVDRLVYFEISEDSISAIEREKQIKNLVRRKKIAMIEKENKEWRDMYGELI